MTTTYQWTIQSLDCVPQEDGKTDVVVTARWFLSAVSSFGKTFTDIDGQTFIVPFTATSYGAQTFNYVSGSPFTPYDQLTQEQVLQWVWDLGVDKSATEAALEVQIQNQINPPVVTPTLPWVQGA